MYIVPLINLFPIMGIEEYGVKPKAEGAKKEKEITVKDILADKKQSALFGEYARSAKGMPGEKPEAGKERAERLLKGESTPQDMEVLASQKDQFLERQKEVQEISKGLNPDFIKKIAILSPKLEVLIKVGGVESIRGAVVSQLEMLAMGNPEGFDKIAASYNQLIEQTGIINTKIEELCKANSITVDEYIKILNETPDEAERQVKLEERVRAQIGRFKIYRGKRAEIRSKAENLNFKDQIDDLKKEYDNELGNVGEMLALSIDKDAGMNKAFMNGVLNERGPEKEQLSDFQEMRGLMQSEENLKTDWESQWKEANAKGTSRSDFEKSYVGGKLGNKKGTWSDIAKAFMNKAIAKW